MKETVIKVKVYKALTEHPREYVLSKQLPRAGTFDGANLEKAVGTPSKRGFLHKVSNSFKEARETHYWIRLLNNSQYLPDETVSVLKQACDELVKIISASIKPTKKISMEAIHLKSTGGNFERIASAALLFYQPYGLLMSAFSFSILHFPF